MKQTFKDVDGNGSSAYPAPNLVSQNAHLAPPGPICVKGPVSIIADTSQFIIKT